MTSESLIGFLIWLVILMMRKRTTSSNSGVPTIYSKGEQESNHRPATIQRIRTTGKPSYRIKKPQVSQVVELGCRGFLEAPSSEVVGFTKGCPGVGLVLDRPRTRSRVFKESLATSGGLLI